MSNDKLAVRGSGNAALAVLDGADRTDRRGKENIDRGDITLPRLAIAQALSKAIDSDKADYIEGLKKGELYNTVTQEVYGKGPIEFAIIRVDKRAMEFDGDNNVVDFNVPWDDARCEFSDGPDGRQKPQAQRIYDYIVLLIPSLEVVVLSLSRTQTKVAKKLNSFQEFRPGAAWAGKYAVSTVSETKGNFTFGSFVIKPSGATPADVASYAEGVFESLKGRTVQTQRENDDFIDADGGGKF